MFRSIRWRITVYFVILICVAMAGLGIYLSSRVRQAYLEDLRGQLTSEARLLADALSAPISDLQSSEQHLDQRVQYYAALLGARITIVALDGLVLAESGYESQAMDSHLYRPEIQAALATGQGAALRTSETLNQDMMYAAVLVQAEGQPQVVVRVAVPLEQLDRRIARLRETIFVAILLTAATAALTATIIAQRTVRPVRELTAVAGQFAAGDLSARLFPTTRDEVGQLTRAFNHMADQLREKVATLADERGRLAVVLEHMADGVLISDGAGMVRLINPAAARMLAVSPGVALGRSYAQVVRHHPLIDLWNACRENDAEQVETVELAHRGLFLRVIATPLRAAEPMGCLVIFQDLTQIRRLETVRRDFVSNISHELRTPLASLKALVDTLRDGALEDRPAGERFLTRIEVEVDALAQMTQELLELSRIESGQVPFRFVPASLTEIISSPAERLRPQAERAGLKLTVDLPEDLPLILADTERIHQVVTNLVHNAIKFTPAGGEVVVSAETGEREAIVAVKDTGVGIPPHMLSRIFERFYKADRARSGGGTGLGLAISRHIVQAHNGRIWAESTEGAGSTFYFSLPIAADR